MSPLICYNIGRRKRILSAWAILITVAGMVTISYRLYFSQSISNRNYINLCKKHLKQKKVTVYISFQSLPSELLNKIQIIRE